MINFYDRLKNKSRKIQLDTYVTHSPTDDLDNFIDGSDDNRDDDFVERSVLSPIPTEIYEDDDTTEEEEKEEEEERQIPDGDWRPCFPMPQFRPYQESTIEAILKGWRSGKRYVIVEAPTGAGKSALALSLGRFFGDTFLATPQKMLQNQYMNDFPDHLFELKGRSNYPCLRLNYKLWQEGTGRFEMKRKRKREVMVDRQPIKDVDYIDLDTWNSLDKDHPFKQTDCANAPCNKSSHGKEMKLECKRHGICEYIRRRDHAFHRSKFTLMNFSNLILFSLLMPDVYKKRNLLILDESHTLENYLYSYATISVGTRQLRPVADYFNSLDDYERITQPFGSMEDFVSYIRDIVIPACESYDIGAKISEKNGSSDSDDDTEKSVKDEFMSDLFSKDERKKVKVLVRKLREFINEIPTEHSHVIVTEKESEGKEDKITGIKIRPFSVAKLGEKLGFSSSKNCVLLMSATILDSDTFCKAVGIPSSEAMFIRVPSTFPAEHRPIIGDLSVGKMSYYYKDKTMPLMLERILDLSRKHENHKGIIHTGSYEFMHKVRRFAKDTNTTFSNRLLCQSQGTYEEKQMMIKLHMNSQQPTILCGPGFIEGIDLKDDLARFNVIMKMPYMSLADRLIQRKAEEFPAWYDLQTALALIQAIGRSVRSDQDWSIIYILDLMWKFFYIKHKDKLFPKYIQDAVRWIEYADQIPFI